MNDRGYPAVDLPTVIGWALILMPLLTAWHEVGGHALACAVQGGTVTEIGAFSVHCTSLAGPARIALAGAGVLANTALAVLAWRLWRSARTDHGRLVLWWTWTTQALVAAGYLAFSGLTGVGDFGLAAGGAMAGLDLPRSAGLALAGVGILAYVMIIRAGIGSLSAMLGSGPATRQSRRRLTAGYYLAAGTAAVAVSLLNPQGLMVTLMSAAASTFGGLAGLWPIGARGLSAGEARPFALPRNRIVILAGLTITGLFALVLGPGFRP